MRADYPVIIDACVLAESATSDLLLRLSEEPRLLLPRWSEDIWSETRRVFIDKLGWPPELAQSRIEAAKTFFPEAMVEGYEHLIAKCENHLEDRHVLAAAIHSKTEAIVTFNVKDFKRAALEPWSIQAVHPSDFLKLLYDHDPATVTKALHEMAAKAMRSVPELLARLGWYVTSFSEHVAEKLSIDLPDIPAKDWKR